MGHLLAIDQGTTGSTALVLATDGRTLGRANVEFPQHFPSPGQVEHEPEEIWNSVQRAISEALKSSGVRGDQIAACGITNQRETTLVWDKNTGAPVHRAIVWQDRRTAGRCRQLRERGLTDHVRERTGLVIDPYFAGTKLEWLLGLPGVRARADGGELLFGTVDTYLIWRLNGGDANAPHLTDLTNASRTLLMDLRQGAWAPDMCELLGVPTAMLPKILPSAADFGRTRGLGELPDGIPITGVAGDQHAALFGQACFEIGDVKCTYGTGAFAVLNTGSEVVRSKFGLLSTVGYSLPGHTVYALEGSCFIAGAAVQWLRDGLGLIGSSSEIEELAASVEDSGGIAFVPALAGLGAPHWDADARGTIVGITRGTTRAHLARATLEAIALQVNDLIQAMAQDLDRPIQRLRVDGGAAANNLLMQLQADISDLLVERPEELETTARGAAMLAGVGAKIFAGTAEAAQMVKHSSNFSPNLDAARRKQYVARWANALARTRSDLSGQKVVS